MATIARDSPLEKRLRSRHIWESAIIWISVPLGNVIGVSTTGLVGPEANQDVLMFPLGSGTMSTSVKNGSFGGLRVGATARRLECGRTSTKNELHALGQFCLRSRGSALVTMMEPANLRNGNDGSRFGWLHWPTIRRVLLQC